MEQIQWNILDLASQLREERLFICCEQQQLQKLNEKVLYASSHLAQLAWVAAQQRDNLNCLIVARPDCSPAVCCQKANAIEATEFVDAYKVLGFQETLAYGELLSNLCMSPQLLASCLVVGDRILPPESMTKVTHSVYTGLLGSSLLPEDKLLALKLLRYLTELQLVPSDNPRRLLRQKSCAFARLYSEFHEGLFSAKLFLTAALHKPIMQLLMEDEMFYDIDPDKATIRYPPEERLKKFGPEGTPEYITQLADYRKWTISCLVRVTNRFVSSIQENMHCFPSSVRWLIRQIAGLLSQAGSIEPKEVNAICTDLIFTHFICPAIVNPEPYGITDAPISSIARFNLIQVAQIVQTLAMTRYEEIPAKVADLYSKFEKDCVSSIIDIMLDGVGATSEEPATIEGGNVEGLIRSCALFTDQELQNLIHFLRSVASNETDDIVDKKQLSTWLIQVPASVPTVNGSTQHNTSVSKLPPPNDSQKRGGILGKVSRSRTSSACASPGRADISDDALDEEILERPKQDVLLIPFGSSSSENIGFLSEQKVLSEDNRRQTQDISLPNGVDVTSVSTNSVERSESQEKRTRFSLLHDEGSIGNTSDNLEAVSEAASNHSVASSLELENEDQNDNLSDMVSANVSGRGTPNISGRDTPSSQITEGEEGSGGVLRGAAGEVRQSLEFHSRAQSKQSRTDIDDKFGKFEIKKLLEGDETVSMVSDTWSTDVLASDSETIEQSERSFPTGSITENTIQQLTESTQLLDVSETASEAWSTDVLASDSERLTEVDTDDTGSVARSDDTARSEIETEGRGDPEGGEETPSSQASLNFNSSFRPIREDSIGRGSLVPPSPTRVDIAVLPVWNSSNQTKPEYRRRIAEYVDNTNCARQRRDSQEFKSGEDSPCLIHIIDKMDKPVEQKSSSISARQSATSIVNVPNPLVLIPNGPPQLMPNGTLSHHSHGPIPLVPNQSIQSAGLLNHSLLNANGLSSQQTVPGDLVSVPPLQNSCCPTSNGTEQSAQPKEDSEPLIETVDSVEVEVKQEMAPEEEISHDSAVGESIMSAVRLSSASLASSSSGSGSSSEPRPKTATPTPDPLLSSYCVMNGHAVMPDGEINSSKNNSQSSAGASASTGAIPKSISFDKTAERGDKDLIDDDSKHKRGFFRNFKLAFKNRRVKSMRGDEPRCYESLGSDGDLPQRLRRMSEETHSTRHDTTEDILAKYRRKPSVSGDSASEGLVEPLNHIKAKQRCEDRLSIDPRNADASNAFADAKRKLRMVLSTADLQHAPWSSQRGLGFVSKENDLISFLQLQLAEAINLQDHSLISHLHETLRCIRLFDDDGCSKLFQSLHEDYQKRSPYIAYLVRSRKGLLSTLAHFERLTDRVKKDHNVCSRFLIAVCVTLFLEKRESMMLQFQDEFQQLTLADEKTDLLDNFLQTLALEMERDSTWQAASEVQLEQARTAIERAVMGRVYIQALYPNGDGDVSRDQVLHEHMKKLSNVITPHHKDLRIPKQYHYECPWPSAQAEISAISAYKTPRDKLQCVFRCATTIMNLLAMACEGNVPAADDFVPVLVYVLIKANPPSLLSTVQYVDSFYGNRLEGEEQYWWIQFCSAIEFIKTMDYGD